MTEAKPLVLRAKDITPVGWQGAAQHTYTVACDGFHAPGPCLPAPSSLAVRAAISRAAAEYEPQAVAVLASRPLALLSVLLEASRRALEAAAPHIAAAERERIRQLAIKHQATYWVGPDGSLVPRRPFALLLQFGELAEEGTP